MALVKAVRKKKKARIVLDGPPGSGKTKTGLYILRGLVGETGRLAVIDTEHESVTSFVGDPGIGDFDVDSLKSFAVEDYVNSLNAIARGRYDGVLVDSGSHEWAGKNGILEFVDKVKEQDARKDAFGKGWRQATPKHNLFIESMLSFPGHVVMTLRSKLTYEIVKKPDGGTEIKKLGLQPIQRDGIEYEFDIVGSMDELELTIRKSRATFLQGVRIDKPGVDFGEKLREWLDAGEDWVPPEMPRQFNVGTQTVTTAGVTEETYGALAKLSRAFEAKKGNGAASRVLKATTGKVLIKDLTEAEGLAAKAAFEKEIAA